MTLAATSRLGSPDGASAAVFRPASATTRILWCFSVTKRLISTWPERAVAFQSMSRTSSPGTYGRRSSNSRLRVCTSA